MLIKNFLNKKRNSTYKPYIIKPKNISVEISNNCNLRCKICNQWKEKNSLKKLEFKDFKNIVNEISEDFKDVVLEFSGPEPLTNQKLLFQVLGYAKKRNVKIAISTNGSLISQVVAEKLMSYSPEHISVSLDSHKPEIQDYIRNCKGLFDRNISSVTNLVNKKKGLNSKTIVSITCTVTDYNTKDLIKVYALCKKLNVDSVNYNAYVTDNSYSNNDARYEKNEFWVKTENIISLKKSLNQIIKIANKHQKPTIATPLAVLKEIPAYFQKRGSFSKGACKAGLKYFHITNFGEMTVCGKGPYLNIKDYTLKDILKSEEFNNTLIETRKCKTPCLNNCFHLE